MTSHNNEQTESNINGLKNLKYNQGEEVVSISCEIIPNSKTEEIIKMCKNVEEEEDYSNAAFDILTVLDNYKDSTLRYIPNYKNPINLDYKFSVDEFKKIEEICNVVKKEINQEERKDELSKRIQFINELQENEGDLLIAKDLIKEDYEKDEAMTFEEFGRQISMDIASVMLECGYGAWAFFKCKNFEDYKNEAKDILKNDRDIDDVAKTLGTTYKELIERIDRATENKEYVDMFKIRDFYCEFSKRTC